MTTKMELGLKTRGQTGIHTVLRAAIQTPEYMLYRGGFSSQVFTKRKQQKINGKKRKRRRTERGDETRQGSAPAPIKTNNLDPMPDLPSFSDFYTSYFLTTHSSTHRYP